MVHELWTVKRGPVARDHELDRESQVLQSAGPS